MDVREVDFDSRDAGGRDGVAKRDTRMCVGGGVQDDGFKVSFRVLNPTHQFALIIRLAEINLDVLRFGLISNQRFDVALSRLSVNLGFARAEQVEVRPVEEENLHRGERLGAG